MYREVEVPVLAMSRTGLVLDQTCRLLADLLLALKEICTLEFKEACIKALEQVVLVMGSLEGPEVWAPQRAPLRCCPAHRDGLT
jgi:hypothetical protein